MKKVIIFGSGNGSNFESIIKYFKNNKEIHFTCVSDNKDAFILTRAKILNIEYYHIPFKETYDFLKDKKYDLYVLAGYMKILPTNVINLGKFINIHPSLLPKYKGTNAIKRAFGDKESKTGVTIHHVSKDVDSGEIIDQQGISIDHNKPLDDLERKIHKLEHIMYPQVIERILGL